MNAGLIEDETVMRLLCTNAITTPQLGDYFKIVTNIILFIIGAPLNTYIFYHMLSRLRTTRLFWLLNLHLNISDLMVMYIYIISDVAWMLAWSWQGGPILCKTVKFLQLLSFQISSNVIICISIDRLLRVMGTQIIKVRLQRATNMLYIAWVVAVICSLPQIAFWNTSMDPCRQTMECMTVINRARWDHAINSLRNNSTHHQNQTHSNLAMLDFWEKLYTGVHLLCIFWIPLLVVGICYTLILYKIRAKNSTRSAQPSPTLVWERPNSTVVSRYSLIPREPNSLTVPSLDSAKTRLRVRRAKTKTLRVTAFIASAYVICWGPYNVLSLWSLVHTKSFQSYEPLVNGMEFFYVLIVLNSVINPFLYGWHAARPNRFLGMTSKKRQNGDCDYS